MERSVHHQRACSRCHFIYVLCRHLYSEPFNGASGWKLDVEFIPAIPVHAPLPFPYCRFKEECKSSVD